MTELQKLRRALKEGEEITPSLMVCFPRHPDIPTHHLFQAILTDGDDLSATYKIHKALIPEWHPVIHEHAVRLDHMHYREVAEFGPKPALTWLRAIVGALIQVTVEVDADGFALWHGGERPVAPETIVAVKVRGGVPRVPVAAREWPPACWRHRPPHDEMCKWDIMAYKVVK